MIDHMLVNLKKWFNVAGDTFIADGNKYVKVTNGNEILIPIDADESISIIDNRTGASDREEQHEPCLAWAIVKEMPGNVHVYKIKSFIGEVRCGVGNRDKLNDRLTDYNDVYVGIEAIPKWGGKTLLAYVWQALRAFTTRKVASAL